MHHNSISKPKTQNPKKPTKKADCWWARKKMNETNEGMRNGSHSVHNRHYSMQSNATHCTLNTGWCESASAGKFENSIKLSKFSRFLPAFHHPSVFPCFQSLAVRPNGRDIFFAVVRVQYAWCEFFGWYIQYENRRVYLCCPRVIVCACATVYTWIVHVAAQRPLIQFSSLWNFSGHTHTCS